MKRFIFSFTFCLLVCNALFISAVSSQICINNITDWWGHEDVKKVNWGSIRSTNNKISFWYFEEASWHLYYNGSTKITTPNSVLDYFIISDDIYILTTIKNNYDFNTVVIKCDLKLEKNEDTVQIKLSDNYNEVYHFDNAGALQCIDTSNHQYYLILGKPVYPIKLSLIVKSLHPINKASLSLITVQNRIQVPTHEAIYMYGPSVTLINDLQDNAKAFFITDTILAMQRRSDNNWMLDFVDTAHKKDSLGSELFKKIIPLDGKNDSRYFFEVGNKASYFCMANNPTKVLYTYSGVADTAHFFSNVNLLLIKDNKIGWVALEMTHPSVVINADTLMDTSFEIIPISNKYFFVKKTETDSIWYLTRYEANSNHLILKDSLQSSRPLSVIININDVNTVFENASTDFDFSNSISKKTYNIWSININSSNKIRNPSSAKAVVNYDNILFYKTDSFWSMHCFQGNLKEYQKDYASVEYKDYDHFDGYDYISTKPINIPGCEGYFFPALKKGKEYIIVYSVQNNINRNVHMRRLVKGAKSKSKSKKKKNVGP